MLNTVEIVGGSDQDLIINCYRAGQGQALQFVHSQNLKRRPGFHDSCGAVFANTVNPSIGQERGGLEINHLQQ